MKYLVVLLWLVSSGSAMAYVRTCETSINGELVTLSFDTNDEVIATNRSWREYVYSKWDDESCPSFATLRFLTPELSDEQREPFCLAYDAEAATYIGFSEGSRDAFFRCTRPKTLCERVNNSKEAALAITGLGAGAAGGAALATSAAGVSVVVHSSGATILTGASGYIAGTLGTLGVSALSILTAPATLAAATISLVVVGGAVYVCS